MIILHFNEGTIPLPSRKSDLSRLPASLYVSDCIFLSFSSDHGYSASEDDADEKAVAALLVANRRSVYDVLEVFLAFFCPICGIIIQEERRLAYVAMSRARERLILSFVLRDYLGHQAVSPIILK